MWELVCKCGEIISLDCVAETDFEDSPAIVAAVDHVINLRRTCKKCGAKYAVNAQITAEFDRPRKVK